MKTGLARGPGSARVTVSLHVPIFPRHSFHVFIQSRRTWYYVLLTAYATAVQSCVCVRAHHIPAPLLLLVYQVTTAGTSSFILLLYIPGIYLFSADHHFYF